ncbi:MULTISPECIES: hypothetical protein [unclassified Spiroplasma]|uniref:hypothetical protein n=1 Tax=unclassified Spiroplasma TaxID=2637901 RepID=UPI0030CE661D
MKNKDNIFNFDANTNSYFENGNIKYYEILRKSKNKYNFNFIVGKTGKGQAFNPKINSKK